MLYGHKALKGYLKTGSYGEYLGSRGMKVRSSEGSTMRTPQFPNIVRVIKSIRFRWEVM